VVAVVAVAGTPAVVAGTAAEAEAVVGVWHVGWGLAGLAGFFLHVSCSQRGKITSYVLSALPTQR